MKSDSRIEMLGGMRATVFRTDTRFHIHQPRNIDLPENLCNSSRDCPPGMKCKFNPTTLRFECM